MTCITGFIPDFHDSLIFPDSREDINNLPKIKRSNQYIKSG